MAAIAGLLPESAAGGKTRPATEGKMFESRHQTAQVFLAAGLLFALLAMISFLSRSLLLGITCLVLEHALAAVGCALFADARGYPTLLGIPFGVALGVMGFVVLAALPDESPEEERHPDESAREGIRNARQRDPGYEVLEDDDD
jgi:hypothetical protein